MLLVYQTLCSMRSLVKMSFIEFKIKYVSYEHVNTLWRCLAGSLNDRIEGAEFFNGKENGEKRKRKKKIKKQTEAERDKGISQPFFNNKEQTVIGTC